MTLPRLAFTLARVGRVGHANAAAIPPRLLHLVLAACTGAGRSRKHCPCCLWLLQEIWLPFKPSTSKWAHARLMQAPIPAWPGLWWLPAPLCCLGSLNALFSQCRILGQIPCTHLLWLQRRTPAWPGCEAGAGKLAAASSGSGSKGRKRDLGIAPGLLTAHTYWPGRRTLAQRLAGHGAMQRAAAHHKQNGEPTASKVDGRCLMGRCPRLPGATAAALHAALLECRLPLCRPHKLYKQYKLKRYTRRQGLWAIYVSSGLPLAALTRHRRRRRRVPASSPPPRRRRRLPRLQAAARPASAAAGAGCGAATRCWPRCRC